MEVDAPPVVDIHNPVHPPLFSGWTFGRETLLLLPVDIESTVRRGGLECTGVNDAPTLKLSVLICCPSLHVFIEH
jgi:hypothetical protein